MGGMVRLVALAIAAVLFLSVFGCAGNAPEKTIGSNASLAGQGNANCADYSVDKCPPACTICPPCEACNSISCQTEQFCQNIGFNRSWQEAVRPKNASIAPQQNLQPGVAFSE